MAIAVTSGVWTNVNASLPELNGLNTQHVRWGSPAEAGGGQSGYRFDGGEFSLRCDGSEFTLGTFTHENSVIYEGSHPNEFDVDLKITIDIDRGHLKREFGFTFHHHETPNEGGMVPDCVSLPAPQSSETVNLDGCEYELVVSGFRQDGRTVTEFVTEENGASSADVVARLVPVGTPDVVIAEVFFKGRVKRTQADEYVEIVNRGTAPADISGWVLGSDDPGQNFTFPPGTVLTCGQMIRVYTNQVHEDTGGFSYGIKRPIWNDRGELALLRDTSGEVVSQYGYGVRALL